MPKRVVANGPAQTLAKHGPFDVIMTDPPWQLATHAPTRGVALGYDQLPDVCIEDLPIPSLSKNGLIFIWVINAKYAKAFDLMKRWGYTYVALAERSAGGRETGRDAGGGGGAMPTRAPVRHGEGNGGRQARRQVRGQHRLGEANRQPAPR